MAKIFYDHLIIIEEVIAVLNAHNLSGEDKEKILELIDQTMHQTMLDTILTHLPKKDHDAFLKKLHAAPHDPAIMLFLKERTTVDIEKEMLKTANTVKRTLTREIEKASEPHS